MSVFDGWNETLLRVTAFAMVFLALAAFELARPKRMPRAGKTQRWTTNLAIVVIDSLIVRALANLAVPVAAIAAAFHAEREGWGLFNWLNWPFGIELLLQIAALDFAIWLQHVAAHKIPILWRIHQMHHADVDIDVTTAIRFHPIEIALSMLWKVICVVALGASPLAVLAFEVILNALAMFSHANIALPHSLDRTLRLVIVTPDMHRVHHSVMCREHDSNYGFNLSVWDRLFKTYTIEPQQGHHGMTIGLAPYQSEAPSQLGWCLGLPFRPQPKDE